MVLKARRISPAIFGFALFCFLLPFVTLSCPGGQFTFTGVQLAAGTTVKEPGMFGGVGTEKKIKPEPLALLALLCIAAGVCVGLFFRSSAGNWGGVTLGSLAVVFLLLLKGKINSDAVKQGEGMLQVTFGIGYWLALMASFLAAAFSAVLSKLVPTLRIEPPVAESPAPVSHIEPGS